jgi:hypothetical protein
VDKHYNKHVSEGAAAKKEITLQKMSWDPKL